MNLIFFLITFFYNIFLLWNLLFVWLKFKIKLLKNLLIAGLYILIYLILNIILLSFTIFILIWAELIFINNISWLVINIILVLAIIFYQIFHCNILVLGFKFLLNTTWIKPIRLRTLSKQSEEIIFFWRFLNLVITLYLFISLHILLLNNLKALIIKYLS